MNCPACAETIADGAQHCPFCRNDIVNAGVERAEERYTREDRQNRRASQPVRLLSILGTAGLAIGALIVLSWLGSLILPGIEVALFESGRAAQQQKCAGNLRRIAGALQAYHDIHGSFPPAVTYRQDGQPMHSWRVLIVPHLEGIAGEVNYNIDEPWNSPGNRQSTAVTPAVFRCPGNDNGAAFGTTHYVAIDGPRSVMNSQHPARLQDIVDGAGSTIMIVEGRDPGMHWAEPRDLDINMVKPFAADGLSSSHPNGFHAIMADGTVRLIDNQEALHRLRGLMTIDGVGLVEGF